MSTILQKPIVLSLNKAWQPICQRTVVQAFTALNGGRNGIAPALGMDIAYGKNPDGTWNFEEPLYINPVSWEEWLKLPVREFDFSVKTPKLLVRAPTVIISTAYGKMPHRKKNLSKESIFERDGGIDQYTGEFVPLHEGNLDHVNPRAKGGPTSFENLVWTKVETNSNKGDKLPHEAGLKLLRPPVAPPPMPVAATIKHALHRDWRHFLIHK